MLRNPAFIIRLLRCATCHCRPINTTSGHWILRASCRTLGALFPTLALPLLWEESLDPSLINEIEGSGEGGEEDEIEEDSNDNLAPFNSGDDGVGIHLGIEKARCRFHDRNRPIEGLDLINRPLTHKYCDKIKVKVLRVQICDEVVCQARLFASWNIKLVSCRCQVPHYSSPWRKFRSQWLLVHESAGEKCDLYRLWLIVCEIEQYLGRPSIYEFDSKDLGFWESHVDVDRELGGNRGFWLSLWNGLVICSINGEIGSHLQLQRQQRRRQHVEPVGREQRP